MAPSPSSSSLQHRPAAALLVATTVLLAAARELSLASQRRAAYASPAVPSYVVTYHGFAARQRRMACLVPGAEMVDATITAARKSNKTCAIGSHFDAHHTVHHAGCDITASHIEAHKRLVYSGAPWGIVLEDDVELLAPVAEIARLYSEMCAAEGCNASSALFWGTCHSDLVPDKRRDRCVIAHPHTRTLS